MVAVDGDVRMPVLEEKMLRDIRMKRFRKLLM